MTRVLVAAMALAAFPLGSRGEEAAVRLTVQPMPAPKPALKYQLLPELGELNPGNPAQDYLKVFMEQRPFFYGKEGVAQRDRFRKMSLLELRLEPMAQNYGGNALRRADWAARLDSLDWQALGRIRDGGPESLPARPRSSHSPPAPARLRPRGGRIVSPFWYPGGPGPRVVAT